MSVYACFINSGRPTKPPKVISDSKKSEQVTLPITSKTPQLPKTRRRIVRSKSLEKLQSSHFNIMHKAMMVRSHSARSLGNKKATRDSAYVQKIFGRKSEAVPVLRLASAYLERKSKKVDFRIKGKRKKNKERKHPDVRAVIDHKRRWRKL